MIRTLTSCVLLILALLPLHAGANGPHVHGTGELHVVIEANRLTIELHSPLENLLGFEHAPRTDKQRAAVQSMVEKLKESSKLFRVPIEAECISTTPSIDAPVVAQSQARTTGKDGAGKPPGGSADEHSNVTAEYEFTCTNTDRIDSIEVNLFDVFPGTKHLKAEVAGPHGQTAKNLSPERRLLKL
jgi:Protein of unknown function (DUF2796)